jgi:trehalose synthase-fused probable maltokinase
VSGPREQVARGDLAFLDEGTLASFIRERRWFGAKSTEVVGAHVLAAVPLGSSPALCASLVEMRLEVGTHHVYQVLVAVRDAGDDARPGDAIAEGDGWRAYEALDDPDVVVEMLRMMRGGATVAAGEARVEFRALPGLPQEIAPPKELTRVASGDQSNSLVVLDGELVVKAYRRLEAGPNPEVEMLKFLEAHGFRNIPALAGWYAYSGPPLDATLGLAYHFIADAEGGWGLALQDLETGGDFFQRHAEYLGEVCGQMHCVLASDEQDPDFAPEPTSTETLALLAATLDDQVGQLFEQIQAREDLAQAVAPVAGRGEEIRERLRELSKVEAIGRKIRAHGDLHLGQVLWTGSDWVVLDFEGEPTRPLPERRRKRSPLRDAAGMLRSLSYAAAVADTRGIAGAGAWEAASRAAFREGYLHATAATGLLPAGRAAMDKLLAFFELEKAMYELRYELGHRPDWVPVAVRSMERLLDRAWEAAP